MEYYSAIKKNAFESILMRWMKLEPVLQSEVHQKEKHQYGISTHIYGIRKMVMMTLYVRQWKRYRCKEQIVGLWEKVRVGWFERRALKHVYYHMWNRLSVQVLCMRQGAQDRCTEMTLRDGMGREVRGRFRMGWGDHVYTRGWFMSMRQKPPQYYKVISLQLR